MAFLIQIDGEEHRVEVEKKGETFQISLGERTIEVDVALMAPGVYSLLIDGQSFEVAVDRQGEAAAVSIGRSVYALDITDERQRASRREKAGAKVIGKHTITAPMPGRVVKVLVKVGDTVKAGQGVVVIEAMKMETELTSLTDGEVKEVHVQEGNRVNGGDVLVVVE